MKNGFIFPLFDRFIEITKWLNIIEPIKTVVWNATPDKKKAKANCNLAIDIFIIFKFFLVIGLWSFGIENVVLTFFTEYLIASNLFIYFYYHIWRVRITDSEHVKRRFVNLILSILFMVLAYTYLYQVPFRNDFTWTVIDSNEFFSAIRFSLSNSFTLSAEITAKTVNAQALVLSQQIMSFSFLAIILSQSIPNKEN